MGDTTSKRSVFFTWLVIDFVCAIAPASAQTCQISYIASVSPGPITGRIILALATKPEPEPRLLIGLEGPAMFGVDVKALRPGQSAIIDTRSIGYPMHSMGDLPAGEYFAQAIVNVYTEVHRADGHTIWVHLNDGRREFVGTSPGNLFSDVQRVHLGSGSSCRIEVTHLIPSVPWPKDDQWVEHVRAQSKLLSRFWGHPVFN